MLQYTWVKTTIISNKQATEMVQKFKSIVSTIGAFDTETTGLHIIVDKPFLFQFGFLDMESKVGYTYAVDIERQPILAKQVIKAWHKLAESLHLYLGHNVKFDLHMMENLGLPYEADNTSDTQFYIRYAHDNLTPKKGGPPLKLKDYATRYIDHTAKAHEKLLDKEKSEIAKTLNLKLSRRLGIPLGKLTKLFKDCVFDLESLPKDKRKQYLEWLQLDVPLQMQPRIKGLVDSDDVPYNILNRTNLINYAHYDIVYTLEIFLKLAPVVTARGNDIGLKFENDLIKPFYEMESTGFKADKQYILDSKDRLKKYILERRQDLAEIAGEQLSVSQSKRIKNLFKELFDIDVPSTGKEELELLMDTLPEDSPVKEFVKTIQELRTLEKWYATYILRFVADIRVCDKLHTQIHQVGTVSGRVTSDFQQFPKKPIIDRQGNEVFYPRKMVQVSNQEYDALVYLDYSQIELRFQAFYTILVGHPDLNLCRAYMPYKCIRYTTSGKVIPFNYKSPEDIVNWDGEWFLEEDPTKRWTPTDVHGATTKLAFDVTEDDPNYKELRYKGKTINFAKNYGAQRTRIKAMFPHATDAEVDKINNAYYEAFPGVKEFHNYCYTISKAQASVTNLFGVKYYGVSGHNLINMLVQGSAAYFLKRKIKELYDYSKQHNVKSRMQMQIHDELSWERHHLETEIFFTFQKIMQDWDDTMVPIVADMEVSTTTWAEKKEVDTIGSLQVHLSNRPSGEL